MNQNHRKPASERAVVVCISLPRELRRKSVARVRLNGARSYSDYIVKLLQRDLSVQLA